MITPQQTGAMETDRLLAALRLMVSDDRHELLKLLYDLRQFSRNKPPLAVSFAMLVVAEVALLDAGIPLNDAHHTQLRSYALDVAERMVGH